MATYEYRCPWDGTFELRLPIGAADPTIGCPDCGATAVRVFSTPMLTRTPRALRAAIDRTERSAQTPEVVTRLPERSTRRRPARPTPAGLPRW